MFQVIGTDADGIVHVVETDLSTFHAACKVRDWAESATAEFRSVGVATRLDKFTVREVA